MDTEKQNILVLMPLDARQQALFTQALPEARFDFCLDCQPDTEQMQQADIILGNPPPALLAYAKKLKWLQLISAGADKYVQPGVLGKDTLLTTASGAYGEAQSEFMLGCLLSLYKKLPLYRDNQNQGLWRDEGNERMLGGETALIIGLGDIGSSFAKRLKAFGVTVIGLRKSSLKPCPDADEIHLADQLDFLLPRADIVCLTLPATEDTRHIMNEHNFKLMKPGAVLLNAGRGATVDTDALTKALEQNKIAGAALDVTEPEPLPSGHPLWAMRNVIITPHVSGRDFLPVTLEKTIAILLDNLLAYSCGKPLRNVLSR